MFIEPPTSNQLSSSFSGNIPPPPQPSDDPMQWSKYIWSDLLNYLQSIQSSDPDHYYTMVHHLQLDWNQANEISTHSPLTDTDKKQLLSIMNDAYMACGGGGGKSPAQQKADQDLKTATDQYNAILSAMDQIQDSVNSLKSRIQADLDKINALGSIVPQSVLDDFKSAQTALQQALKQLSTLQEDSSALQQELSTIKSYDDKINGTTDLDEQNRILNDELEPYLSSQFNPHSAYVNSEANQLTQTLSGIAATLTNVETALDHLKTDDQQKADAATQQAKKELDEIEQNISPQIDALDKTIADLTRQMANYQNIINQRAASGDPVPQNVLDDFNRAQADLQTAQTELNKLKSALSSAQNAFDAIKTLDDQIQTASPGEQDVILSNLQKLLQTQFSPAINQLTKTAIDTLTNNVSTATSEVKKVGDELQPQPVTTNGQSVYVDMGLLYRLVNSCIIWWPQTYINQTELDALLQSTLFSTMKAEGLKMLDLSFAQLSDIDALAHGGEGSVGRDTITPILHDGFPVGSTGKNFLQYLIDAAHANGAKVDLSFGGANAQGTDWKIQGDPATQAGTLVQFMNQYGIDSVDWDIEDVNSLTTLNTKNDLLTFFQTLHQQLSSIKPESKQSIITLLGDVGSGPGGSLSFLFSDFDRNFDSVNLMLYSNSQYYLDADNPSWGIKQWLSYVKDPSKIHIGFFDSIHYEEQGTSAGEQYNIPAGATRGQAAAWVYKYVLNQLGLTPDKMGQPFWWVTDPGTIAGDTTIQDFWKELSLPN